MPFFVVFILFCVFGVVNVMVGIVVETTITNHEKSKERHKARDVDKKAER